MSVAQILTDGDWRPANSGDTIPMVDPSDGVAFSKIARGGAEDINRAVASARKAFESHWSSTPGFERGRLIRRLGELVDAHHDELAKLESRDTGKPLKQSNVDATVAARYFEFYSGAADKLHGDTIPFMSDYQVLTLREPLGVTGHIIPWNYPLQMGARTIGATLAAGNTLVLKPAEEGCLSVLRLTELALEAGIPADAINVVTGYGEEAGAALAAHADVDHVSFTGSPEVGTLVQQAAATQSAVAQSLPSSHEPPASIQAMSVISEHEPSDIQHEPYTEQSAPQLPTTARTSATVTQQSPLGIGAISPVGRYVPSPQSPQAPMIARTSETATVPSPSTSAAQVAGSGNEQGSAGAPPAIRRAPSAPASCQAPKPKPPPGLA